jgi:hypothetical protein
MSISVGNTSSIAAALQSKQIQQAQQPKPPSEQAIASGQQVQNNDGDKDDGRRVGASIDTYA